MARKQRKRKPRKPRKGPMPKPTRIHRSTKTDFLDRIYESLRRLELDE